MDNLIANYKPGCATETSGMVLKMSSNENPLGPCPSIGKMFQMNCNQLERYPRSLHTELKLCIIKKYKLDKNYIVFGNGSDELLSLICNIYLDSTCEAIICNHSFLLYKTQILSTKAIPVIAKESNNKVNINNIVKLINAKTKIIFITIPSNPIGLFLTNREIGELIKLIESTNILLVLDLAYSDYVIDDRFATNINCLTSNLIVVKTLSKIYGLASLRIG